MKEVVSYADLQKKLAPGEHSYLLLYKPGSEISDCAYKNISSAGDTAKSVPVYYADVTKVKDIHPRFNITSAPSLLEFEKGNFKNLIKGCHEAGYYKALFEDALYQAAVKSDENPQKNVTVYSTPTCTWCNTLKTFLKKNRVRFTDIDISRDPHAAEELVRRSGQTGVPQTEIGGEIIVGFNQSRISELLGLKKSA